MQSAQWLARGGWHGPGISSTPGAATVRKPAVNAHFHW